MSIAGSYILYLIYILYFRAWSVPWIIWRLWWTRGVSVRWFLHVKVIYHCFELLLKRKILWKFTASGRLALFPLDNILLDVPRRFSVTPTFTLNSIKKILQVSTYFSKSNFHYLWLLWGTCTSLSLDGVGHFYYLVTRRLFHKAFWNVLLANWAYDCLVVLYNLRNWNMRLMRKQLIFAARQAIDQTPGQKNNPDTKRTQN